MTSRQSLHAELVAVVFTVDQGVPRVLAAADPTRLPSGALASATDSLQATVREFARDQTGHELGYVEQLYTFADGHRRSSDGQVVSISYLGLTRVQGLSTDWTALYDLLPWEDRRGDDHEQAEVLRAALHTWCGTHADRLERAAFCFGWDAAPWRPELALQRYELLWEARLVRESRATRPVLNLTGPAMLHDHRRILTTGLSRLRSALQYRPVVFELMPATFTLGQLQETVEALAGQELHKQNFRRLVEVQHQLVEPTDAMSRDTGGRPARLYRFRREVFAERHQVGTKLPIPRAR